jgi:hypothetical protein
MLLGGRCGARAEIGAWLQNGHSPSPGILGCNCLHDGRKGEAQRKTRGRDARMQIAGRGAELREG